jgi:hypothetical protein
MGIPKQNLTFGVEMPSMSRSASGRVLFLVRVGDSDRSVLSWSF